MDSIEKVINFYNRGTSADMYHQVSGQLLSNIHSVSSATIYDIAEVCYSSPATISRLVKKMGFENYSTFKNEIHYALTNYRYLNRIFDDSESQSDEPTVNDYFSKLFTQLHELERCVDYESLVRVTDSLHNAEHVLIYATADMQAHILQKELIISGVEVQMRDLIGNPPGKETAIPDETYTLLVFIPDLIELSGIKSVLKQAKHSGAEVITVCSRTRNSYSQYSDTQVSFEGSQTAMDLYQFSIIINLIKYIYAQRFVNKLIEDEYNS